MNTPLAPRSSLGIRGFALGVAALLTLPAISSAQSLLYQWNFDNAGSLAPTATGGGVTGGTLAITNAGATSSTVNSAGVTGATGDYGLDLSSTTYNVTNPSSKVAATVGSFPTLTAMTVTMWIKSSDWAVAAGTANSRLLELNSASGQDGDKLYFALNGGTAGAGNNLQAGINSSGTGTISTVNGSGLMPITGSSWVFVALTWDSTLTSGSNLSTFLGNTSASVVQAGTAFGAFTTAMSSVTALSVGNRDTTTPSRNFDGVMDDIRIYNGVMTLSQLDAIRLQDVSAIPEPSTYAAILGGLALAGAVIRRRRLAA